jgi:NAD(P)-dependent dehydrogenase (short-subunit alcohol dehydrogenase family)
MARTLVTGANRGIGLEIARILLERGDRVVACVRESSPELRALADKHHGDGGLRIVEGIDVSDDEVVPALRRELADESFDVLVLNAGILEPQGPMDLGLASIERQLQVNAIGPLRVVAALGEGLASGAKIALVTSRMGSVGDNTSGGYYGYRMSKAALNAAGKSLAIDLAGRGIAVVLLHPGFVRTRMTSHHGDVDPATAASNLVARIDELSVERTGRFMHANGEELPW